MDILGTPWNAVVMVSLAVALEACAGTRPPPLDDQTRRVAPVPACVQTLPERPGTSLGTMRVLREDQIWRLVLPAFDQRAHTLPRGAVACTGVPVLDDPALRGGTPTRPWPFHEADGDIEYGTGGDRIKVAWLKMFTWPDGTVGGPIALIRANEHFADLFAIGALRGPAERMRLDTHRIGDEILLVAEQDGCTGRKQGADCESRMSLMLAHHGELERAASPDLWSERVGHGRSSEPGSTSIVEYRLTTAIDYKPDGVHMTEQVQESDEAGRGLRKAEVERVFVLNDEGKLIVSQPSLWERFAVPTEEKKPHDAKPPPAAPPKHPRTVR